MILWTGSRHSLILPIPARCDYDRLLPTLWVGHAEGVVGLAPQAEEVPGEPGVEEGPEVLLLPWKKVEKAILLK